MLRCITELCGGTVVGAVVQERYPSIEKGQRQCLCSSDGEGNGFWSIPSTMLGSKTVVAIHHGL